MSRTIHVHDYLPRDYEEVRELLLADLDGLVRSAGRSAVDRGDEVFTTLGIRLAGLSIRRDVTVEVGKVEEHRLPWPVTTVLLAWRAVRLPRAFPSMDAMLEVAALSPGEAQLSLVGRYQPPLGPIGEMIDRVALHRVAQASLHRFLEELVGCIEARLADRGRPVP